MIKASFRDPSGCTWVGPDVVHRAGWSDPQGSLEEQEALESLLNQFQAEGKWIPAKALDQATLPAYVEGECPLPRRAWVHPRVFFPSYAYEWSPAMLHCAAELTLELNERLLAIGWELKDASPANILFEGPKPIFVDHLSPARRKPGQMGWTAYGQFNRTFLIPLCLHQLNDLPLSWLYLARREGLPPEDAAIQLSLFNRLRPSVFGMITLPALLSRRQIPNPAQGLRAWKGNNESMGLAITAHLLKGLGSRLLRWAPPPPKITVWSEYDQAGESYTPEGIQTKETFIRGALENCQPKAVLDLGCNTGRYSRLAAESGADVVAVDGDASCVDQLWLQARNKGLNIQPLLIDLGRPSPAMGWENGEGASFLGRVEGRFDMVIALALIHHLLVRERVPLEHFISHLARLKARWVVLEWVPVEDQQFRRLAGVSCNLFSGYTKEAFKATIQKYFQIHRFINIPGTSRTLYLLCNTDNWCPQ